jgi:hypothetical protein
MIDEKKLVRISTYAKLKNITPQWVAELIKDQKVKTVIIDKTTFIVNE